MLLADNHFTPVIGLDIHFTIAPPYNPFHPYIGMVIDPADYIPFIGATVQINGIKRGVSDTSGIIMPFVHIPLVGSFAAPPIIGHESMNVFSSLTVFADGSRLSPKSYMVFTCNDIGLPLSASLAPNPKKPGKLTLIPTLFAPTSFSLPIPTGMPVNVGGPYAPDWGGVLMGLLMSIGFSSLLRLGKKMFNKALKKMAGDNSLSKLLCKLGFEPINLVNGNVIYEGTDFEMQGPLPLQWERKWSSYSSYKGWLGYGTHNNYDRTVELFPDEDAIGVRTADGRVVAFPLLVEGESFYLRQEKTTLSHKGHYFTAFDHATKQTFYFEQFNGYNVYRLTRIVNAVGFEIQLQVSGNRLEGIIDSSGRAYKVTSNIKGCIEKIELKEPTGDSILVSYEYDDKDNLIAIKDALGKATTIEYENHLMVKKTDRNGQTFYWEYDGPTTGAKCIHTWGDGGWQEGWIEYFPEEGYNLVTDANGAVTTYYYTPDQLVTQIKDPLGNSTFTQYTDFMEVYRNIDEEGYITGYSYDENGNLTSISYPDGNVSHMAYDENDQLIVTIDPEGSKMVYTYSEENPYLVSSIIEPDNGITTFEYNDKGLIANVAKGEQKVRLEYDNQHNLTQLTNHEGTSTQWQYNYRGQTLYVKTPNLYPQSFFYDTLGRVTKIQSNSKGETRLAYNAYEEIVEIQDTQRHIKLDYTPMGSLRRREENGVSVFFAYDKMEQLLAITNEHNERYEFTRNNAGNIIKEEGFDGMIRTFNLDATGKTIKVNRPGDKHSLYEYDPMGKVTRIEHHDGTWELFGYNKRGQLTEARNQNVCVALTRDAMGRVVKETQTHGVLGDKGFEIISEYDKNGNRVVLKSSLGAEQKNSFDSLGNLENIQAQTTALLENQKQAWETHIKRNALGQEVERIVSGGLTISTDYDVNGNILSHKAKSNQRETFHRVYHWNGNQQLQRVVDAITGGDTHFTYDAFGNLAKAQYKNGEVDYKLPDEVGNLYKSWLRNDRKYGKNGQLLADQNWRYHYDDEGNLIEKENGQTAWQYHWYASGMLAKITKPNGVEVQYEYDALGRRTAKIVHDKITRYCWDGNVLLHEFDYNVEERPTHVLDEDGFIVLSHPEPVNNLVTWIYDSGSFVPSAKIIEDKKYSILSDYLGRPAQAYNEEGDIVWEAQYDIYGKITKLKGDKIFVPFRQLGQYEDSETPDLYYNRFRFYDCETGLYLSQDPIKLAGNNPTMYGYVKNSNSSADIFGLMDPFNILFTQNSISNVLSDGPRAGESLTDLIEEAKTTKKLPQGLELNITEFNYPNGRSEYVTLNNRTLYIAQQANINVNPNIISSVKADNKLRKLLDGGFPLDDPNDLEIKCKK